MKSSNSTAITTDQSYWIAGIAAAASAAFFLTVICCIKYKEALEKCCTKMLGFLDIKHNDSDYRSINGQPTNQPKFQA